MIAPPGSDSSLKTLAHSYLERLSGYGLIELGIVAALESAALGALTPVFPLYLKNIGATPEVIGLFFAVFYVALATGEFGWGILGDRIGIKVPLMIGTALAGVTTAGFILTRDINLLYVINFLRAIGTSALFPTARGHIGSTVPLKSKATFMAYYATIQSLGRILGTFFGGLLGDRDMTYVFILSGIFLIAATAVAVRFFRSEVFKVKKTEPMVEESTNPPARFNRVALVNLVVLGLTISLFNFSFTVRNSFLPLYATGTAGASVAEVGYLFTAWGVVSLVCTLPLGRIADRLGFRATMVAGHLILAVTMAAFAFANSFFLLMLIMIVNSLSNCLFRPASSARFSQLMSRGRQSTAMGILGVFEDVGSIIGPGISGFIWERPNGPFTAFLMSAGCAGLGAFLGLVKLKERKASRKVASPTTV